MKSNNSINIPEAKNAMDKFKMQAASDFCVNYHIKFYMISASDYIKPAVMKVTAGFMLPNC